MLLIQERHSDAAVNRLLLQTNSRVKERRETPGGFIECFLGVLAEMERLRRCGESCRE